MPEKMFNTHIQWTIRRKDGKKIKIYGETSMPRGFESAPFPRPTIVMAHGFGSSHKTLVPYAEALAQRGYVVYNIDFRGGGPESKSDGSWEDMSIETEAEDLLAAVGLMREEPFCDPKCLFLFGASQGGVVCSLVADEHPELFRGMVLLYPAFVLHEDALRAYPEDRPLPEHVEALGRPVGKAYIEAARRYVPEEHMSYPGQVLILQGDKDEIVPPASSEKAASLFPSCRLETIEGAGHGFSGPSQKKAADAAFDFIFHVLHDREGRA